MNKIGLVIRREYLLRVKKKSFVILTLLMPVLMLAITVLPAVFMANSEDKDRVIGYYDATNSFDILEGEHGAISFIKLDQAEFNGAVDDISNSDLYAYFSLPTDFESSLQVKLISNTQVTMTVEKGIRDLLSKEVKRRRVTNLIASSDMPDIESRIKELNVRVNINSTKVDSSGEEKNGSAGITMGLGYGLGFMIYMFIFIYGGMVMRSVMDEKQNRVVEVIVQSVKPFSLLMGKIIGVALVGFTQIFLWLIVGVVSVSIASSIYGGDPTAIDPEMMSQISSPEMEQMIEAASQENPVAKALDLFSGINLPLVIGSFIFYFLGGFLFYSSLMAAVGAAVDSQEDTQQLMLPVTVPLIFSIIILSVVIQNPDGTLALWSSMIPFTSPVIMMVRVGFDVPTYQLVISGILLIFGFIGSVWLASKIYRIGILMYGKKVGYKDIWRWLRYR